MAGRADQPLVFTGQGKARRGVMIEPPHLPVIAVVTLDARRRSAQGAGMVIVGVTGLARNALGRERLVCVASTAGKRCVLADQREPRQGVIEHDLALPGDDVVAASAIIPEFALMRIICGMTADTGYGQVNDVRGLFVTRRAFERVMRARQREARHRIMIEAVFLPVTAVVAIGAARAVAPFVDVILGVTGKAAARWFSDTVGHAMARRAGRAGMLTEQGESGVAIMVERCVFPS